MSQRSRQDRVHQEQRRTRGKRAAGLGVLLLLLALGGLALASAFGSDSPSADKGGAASGTVRVSMTEFAFDPDPIVLQHGPGARLEVVNDGTTAHDLLIGRLGKGTPDLPPGQRMVLDLSAQPAGTYRVVCDLPGHTEAGMVTELILR